MPTVEWIQTEAERLQYLVFFGLFALLALAETRFPRRPGTSRRRSRWPTNLGLTALNVLTLGALPVSLVAAARWAEVHGWGLLRGVSLPVAVLLVVNLLARGFISFATHYLMHKVPLFWRLHRVHHLDTELDVTTTVRFHPLEFVVSTLPAVPLVVALGLTPWALSVYELLDVAVTLFSHANLRLPGALEGILRYLIVTPDLHRIHHSSFQPETDSNFGAVFPVWDLVFGTFLPESRDGHAAMRLGLDEVREPRSDAIGWLLRSVLQRTLGPA